MEELCQKLPEGDPAHQTLDTAGKDLSEVHEEIENTHQKLMQHPDKWKEYNTRCSNLKNEKVILMKPSYTTHTGIYREIC